MAAGNTVFWVDMLAASKDSCPPKLLSDEFDVQVIHRQASINEMFAEVEPLAIFYDCDYTDKKRLSLIREMKLVQSSVPFVLVTLQHSEALAVWTFRQGAMDYLVKPVSNIDLERCIARLHQIREAKQSSPERDAFHAADDVPLSMISASKDSANKLAPAVYYVKSHYDKRIYSDAVARMCGLSPTYFSKAFRERYDMPFQTFLQRYRVSKAAMLLRKPNASVSDVCYSVGFRDPAYFGRVFKRFTGVSPGEYATSCDGSQRMRDDFSSVDDASNSSSQIVRMIKHVLRN